MIVILAKALLYLSFSLLLGETIFRLVAENKKPVVAVPNRLLITSVIVIPILLLVPIYDLILQVVELFEVSFSLALEHVMLQLAIGKSWFITLGLCVLLLILYLISKKSPHKSIDFIKLLTIIGMIMAQGWASHASSLNQGIGFLSHFAHFFAVSTWIGLLLVAGWFSSPSKRWLSFLSWFTPIAILSVITVTISGLSMMNTIAPEYFNSWMLSYGQALLIKHLFIIPLLIFAFINSYLIKRRLKLDLEYNPIQWLRIESVIALMIFSITAYMGQQPPPHEVARTLLYESPSPLFLQFFQGDFDPAISLGLHLNGVSVLSFILALFTILLIIITYIKKWPVYVAFLFSVMLVALAYLALMTSIAADPEIIEQSFLDLLQHTLAT